ncbi:hypothetical protein BDV23DRAFT_149814 [Aspergillus alliaceus]|uniref:Uncharacterized protein n=1 Tax=Petromyces alliaceus TaxID=209559 RepID=A0A5N7CHK5_PETAA|nr:hypothetical protein BDV23DRAFT_149814 [Aspergillus alliaceus]
MSMVMGVPHRGGPASIFASVLSLTAYWRGSSAHLLRYMEPDSLYIRTLNAEFVKNFQNPQSTLRPLPFVCNVLEKGAERLLNALLGPKDC